MQWYYIFFSLLFSLSWLTLWIIHFFHLISDLILTFIFSLMFLKITTTKSKIGSCALSVRRSIFFTKITYTLGLSFYFVWTSDIIFALVSHHFALLLNSLWTEAVANRMAGNPLLYSWIECGLVGWYQSLLSPSAALQGGKRARVLDFSRWHWLLFLDL